MPVRQKAAEAEAQARTQWKTALVAALVGGALALAGALAGVVGQVRVNDNNNDREDARRLIEVKQEAYIELVTVLDAQAAKLDKLVDLSATYHVATGNTIRKREDLAKEFRAEFLKIGQLMVTVDAASAPVRVYGGYEAVRAASAAANVMNAALIDSISAPQGREEFLRFRHDMVSLIAARTDYVTAIREDLGIKGKAVEYGDPEDAYPNPFADGSG